MRVKTFSQSVAVIALMCTCASAVAAESVTVEHDSPLMSAPRGDASAVAQVKRGTAAEVLGRQGAWLNLKTAAGTGWVNSFNVRFATDGAAPASSSSGGLGRVLGRKPSTTATIGIRGLEAEDLKGASFNGQQVGLLEKYAVSRQEAESAARESGLTATRIDYLNP